MVVLDTNVVSELMRDDPHADVLLWLDDRPTRELFVTAITEAEIRTGIALLPQGRRRRGIAEAADRAFGALFAGRPVSQADGQIAAIARSRGMAVATRNIGDFDDMGIEIIDPWAGA